MVNKNSSKKHHNLLLIILVNKNSSEKHHSNFSKTSNREQPFSVGDNIQKTKKKPF